MISLMTPQTLAIMMKQDDVHNLSGGTLLDYLARRMGRS